MPTAYIKKIAKINKTTPSVIEKVWNKAKSIAESYGKGGRWGYIVEVFKGQLKKEGYRTKAKFEIKGEIVEACCEEEALSFYRRNRVRGVRGSAALPGVPYVRVPSVRPGMGTQVFSKP